MKSPHAILLIDGEFVAVTADDAPSRGDEPLRLFLRRMRLAFHMDVVFVSQFVEGQRVIRLVDCESSDPFGVPEGATDPLEESYCFHVVQGRLPEVIPDTGSLPLAQAIRGTQLSRVGSHLAVPIVGATGLAFGTVCCFCHEARESIGSREQLETLQTIAALMVPALESTSSGVPIG